ncbi:HTTM domain-containing protein [Urbifossiella limnaea]|uniref:HTTM-like domain-containing protein n=1 Tax=Urbifossiella limnaea TaxID=2528023 RepID=A0A517XQA8_9BACT|nr:HTTM domain-containing protein [Urbifossiella limnaea]QDU19690.1 hypothetical protein ETAA1_16210 [Urbifossiella limnaea]
MNMTFRQRWAAFWFTPVDPSTLGFMRVMTGLLILYIYLAHSLDLQNFFGRHAWYGHSFMDRERREFPWSVSSFTKWNDEEVTPRLPEFPHRRASILAYIRALPEGKAERKAGLRFLDRAASDSVANGAAALTFLQAFHETGKGQEQRVYAALAEGRQLYGLAQDGQLVYLDAPHPARESTAILPAFLLALPEPDRRAAADDLKAAILPPAPVDTKYLVNHLMELDPRHRVALVRFMANLPDDRAARNDTIDFLDYWNNDPDPNRVYHFGHRTFSVWFHVTDPRTMAAIHGGVLLVILLFALGVCTRVTGVLTWVATLSYVHRTEQVLFGMDVMANILLTYLVVGDSGAALSVDRVVAKYRAVRASLARCGHIDAATRAFLDRAPPSKGAALGVRLIQVHFCFIYLAAGLSKLKGQGWWNGFAFYDVMINPEFTMLRYEWFETMARGLASVKPVYYAICTFGVWFTLGLEISFPFLVWTRLRPFYLWLAVLLHAGIGILMGLTMFELLMMVMLLAYLPAGVIRDRLRGGPGLPRLAFGFDPAVPAQARAAALVCAADADAQVSLEPSAGVGQPVVKAGGVAQTGAAAAGAVFGSVRLLRWARHLLKLPGVGGLAGRWVSPAPPAAQPPVAVGS